LDPIQRFTVDTTIITTLLVLSVHVTFRCGLFSLATMGFSAAGAYTTAVLVTSHGWNSLLSISMAPLVAMALALIVALPVLRLRGIYFALGTLALGQAIVVGISNFDFTNGVLGIAGIPIDVDTNHLVVLLIVVLVFFQLSHRSFFGRAAEAVRLDERTAAGLGINVFRVRLMGFLGSAFLAGLAGALEAHRTGVISPEQYNFGVLVLLFTYVLIGGNEHWIGPVATCWTLVAVHEWLEGKITTEQQNLAYGVLLIVVMMVAPYGLTHRGFWRRIFRRGGGADNADPSREGPDLATETEQLAAGR
jgi:branched-chain amino acid transport system permease protein